MYSSMLMKVLIRCLAVTDDCSARFDSCIDNSMSDSTQNGNEKRFSALRLDIVRHPVDFDCTVPIILC